MSKTIKKNKLRGVKHEIHTYRLSGTYVHIPLVAYIQKGTTYRCIITKVPIMNLHFCFTDFKRKYKALTCFMAIILILTSQGS